MNRAVSYNLTRLAEHLQRIFAHTRVGAVDPSSVQAYLVMGGEGTALSFHGAAGCFAGAIPEGAGPTLSIVDDGYFGLMDFVDESLKDYELRELVGKDAVRQQVMKYVQSSGETIPTGDRVELVRDKIVRPLRDAIRPWVCLVPIANLDAKASLLIGSTEFVSRVSGSLDAVRFIMEHQFAGDADTQDAQAFSVLDRVGGMSESATAFMRVTVRAHPKHVNAVAAAQAENTINTLRAFTPVFYRHDQRAKFGLPMEIQSGHWWSMAMGQDDRHSIHFNSHGRGSLCPFELDESKIAYLTQNLRFDRLRSIAARPAGDRNTLEQEIMQSVQSLGRAVVAPSVDRAFLECAIALEQLLILDNETTTTERFADRLALLIGANKDQRTTIAKNSKRLYDIRSRIVHAGLRDVVDDDWRTIERLAIRGVVEALGLLDRFDSHEKFCKDLNERKYQ